MFDEQKIITNTDTEIYLETYLQTETHFFDHHLSRWLQSLTPFKNAHLHKKRPLWWSLQTVCTFCCISNSQALWFLCSVLNPLEKKKEGKKKHKRDYTESPWQTLHLILTMADWPWCNTEVCFGEWVGGEINNWEKEKEKTKEHYHLPLWPACQRSRKSSRQEP